MSQTKTPSKTPVREGAAAGGMVGKMRSLVLKVTGARAHDSHETHDGFLEFIDRCRHEVWRLTERERMDQEILRLGEIIVESERKR